MEPSVGAKNVYMHPVIILQEVKDRHHAHEKNQADDHQLDYKLPCSIAPTPTFRPPIADITESKKRS